MSFVFFTVLQSSACLLVFPLRGGFCSSLFYIIIKRTISSAFESSTSSLVTERISQDEDSAYIYVFVDVYNFCTAQQQKVIIFKSHVVKCTCFQLISIVHPFDCIYLMILWALLPKNASPNTNNLYIWVHSFHTLQNCCNRGGNVIFKCMNVFVATVWKCLFLF